MAADPAWRELRRLAEHWASADPDPETACQLRELAARGELRELRAAMTPLAFGTAGLRGVVGAGPGRMNDAVVGRVTAAVSAALGTDPTHRGRPIVVAHDARLSSLRFARVAADALRAKGWSVRRFEQAVPTPWAAFAAKRLEAAGAIVITASHNPPQYNGYKVYGPDASPITSKLERAIADGFLNNQEPRDSTRAPPVERPMACELVDESWLFEEYWAKLDALRSAPTTPGELVVAYSALHGVGAAVFGRLFLRAGYDQLRWVHAQRFPDGRFPTLTDPNPEHASALERLLATAQEEAAHIALANDPDADRLAVAIVNDEGCWVPLTGNQVGILLLDHLLRRSPANALVVSSVVSTPLVEKVAASYGARAERCLTGFKWISWVSAELARTESRLPVLGFEEATGYSVGRTVHDKDGIGAALFVADLAAECLARGSSLWGRLGELLQRHGFWVSVAESWTLGDDEMSELERRLDQLVASPPVVLGDTNVEGVVDWRERSQPEPCWRGSTQMLELTLARGRVMLRPSGTEPKVKVYVDWRAHGDPRQARWHRAGEAEARAVANGLARELGLADVQ